MVDNAVVMGRCSQAALATTSFIQRKLTLEFIKTNSFLLNIDILGIQNCNVYDSPYAGGISFAKGLPCGKVNPVENTYKGRTAQLEHFHVAKKICKETIMCSDFSVADFANLLRNETWQALIELLQTNFLSQLMSDTINVERSCDGNVANVKAIDDNITGSTIQKLEKASFTADTVYQILADIVGKFRAANIGANGITIFVPYALEQLISGMMANKQCCQWFSDIQFNNNVSGYTIAGMKVTIVALDKALFPAGASGYTRILAVANNRTQLVYNTFKIYGGFSPITTQYLASAPVQTFLNSLPMNSMLDFYLGEPSKDDIGVALLMKALTDFTFRRIHKNSILMIDIKNDIFS